MKRPVLFAVSVTVALTAAIVYGVFYADRHMGETGHVIVFLLMTVYGLVASIWALVSWIRMWRNMTPDERQAYKESRRTRWKRSS